MAGQPANRASRQPSLLAAHAYHLAAAAALLAVGLLAFFPVQSDDLFMYLAIGRRMVGDGAIPAVDPFLFSLPGYHWQIAQEWGSYLTAYAIHAVGGWTLLVAAKATVIVATASVALVTAARLGVRSALVPWMILLASLAGFHRFIERASLASDFLTAVVLAIVVVERATPGKARYLLPVIFLLWVNTHPGFYVGLAICALAVLADLGRIRERPAQTFAACAIASAAICLVNPHGVHALVYPLRPLFDSGWDVYRAYNHEWMSTLDPVYRQSIHVPAFAALIVSCVAAAVAAWPRRPWFELGAGVLFVWLGFSAVRFLTTASFGLCVIGAALAAKSSTDRRAPATATWSMRRHGASLAVALVALTLCGKVAFSGYDTLAGPRRLGVGLDPASHPIAAADFIDRIGLATPLYNQVGFGAYLAWRWDGQRKLFVHGHLDDMDFLRRQVLAVSDTPADFQRVVDQHRLGAFLLRRPDAGSPLPLVYRILGESPDWRLVFMDDRTVLYLRRVIENRQAFDRYEATSEGWARAPIETLPIIGAWTASVCGVDISAMRIRAAGGILAGEMTASEYVANPNASTCADAPLRLTGNQITLPLSNVTFDGRIVRLTISPDTAEGRTDTQAVELRWEGGTLTVVADQAGQQTRVFRRAESLSGVDRP